jgi:hypothetical protein
MYDYPLTELVGMPNLGYVNPYKPTPIRQPIQPPSQSYSAPSPVLSEQDYSWNPPPIRQPTIQQPTIQPISPPSAVTVKSSKGKLSILVSDLLRN